MSQSNATPANERDYSKTLFLPQTEFPMRAGLPQREPEILKNWERINLYQRQREAAKGRPRFILHDGPPYANGHIHIGHSLNKVLKDLVSRSQQSLGFDSPYVPGWDCHGLPIEWKIEEEYRAKGKAKPDLTDPEAINAFRQECRSFAEHWLSVQREEFKRLGVVGDWQRPYSTMAFHAEAQIAREIMKFAENGLLYRGSKPVMWSVVEKTALAEAEIEYHDYQSDQVWVKFPVRNAADPGSVSSHDLQNAYILIWTTTPWTLPGNRAISFSSKIEYGLYEVTANERDFGPKLGERYIIAKKLAEAVAGAAKITLERRHEVPVGDLASIICSHPLVAFPSPLAGEGGAVAPGEGSPSSASQGSAPSPAGGEGSGGYHFAVPLLDGEHVTDDAGTGFVHTAPGHGREDFEIWTAAHTQQMLRARKIDPAIPYTVDEDGFYTREAPGFDGKRVITDKGERGDANEAVIKALIAANMLVARARLKHQYPHSWRSKKPIIFRNTPQWFIAMDKPLAKHDKTLRELAFAAIEATQWVPPTGKNRIRGMIENKPDWVMSRQRAWGVPITVFVARRDVPALGLKEGDLLHEAKVNAAIAAAFETEGADAWFADKTGARFLAAAGLQAEDFEKVTDVLDVWFDSGSTHTYVLNTPDFFPDLGGIRRAVEGGRDTVLYLEGSDQHRGWFQSSLLESCGTRAIAPFDVVVTHGFTLDEEGRKMSKSLGNGVEPQDVIKQSGADILRLWVASCDYWDDQRVGPEILKSTADTYRKLRNTMRWALGTLAHFDVAKTVPYEEMPELERYILHLLTKVYQEVREAYAAYDYKRVIAAMISFMTGDLSAFYFDIRKDVLYCDPASSKTRLAALTVVEACFRAMTTWLAPILVFTCDEAWLARYGNSDDSVHIALLEPVDARWIDAKLAARFEAARRVRRAVNGALEVERTAKRIGSSLEANPVVHLADDTLQAAITGLDLAELCITSGIEVRAGEGPAKAFRIAEVPGAAVEIRPATGVKCARSWKYFDPATADPAFPDITPRDAAAMREREKDSGVSA